MDFTDTRDFMDEKIKQAQKEYFYIINGIEYQRIPYGNETLWSFWKDVCHDCNVIKGQLHVPGCEMEECPVCRKQSFCCACEYDGKLFASMN